MCNQSSIASFLLVLSTVLHGASSFTTTTSRPRRSSHGQLISKPPLPHTSTSSSSTSTHATSTTATSINWTPQDLTKDNIGYLPIPPNDYIKQYQSNPQQLWPVEFFVIVYRHIHSPRPNTETTKTTTTTKTTQILVRKSANGTSKYGVGTGVPVTRWMLSSQSPPRGYQKVLPEIMFDACNFPEFATDNGNGRRESWTYSKIDICEDAFHSDSMNDDDDGEDDRYNFEDVQLQEYASNIRQQLQNELSQQLQTKQKEGEELSDWDLNVLSTVKNILDNDNSVAAIQGSFRMSGLFASKDNNSDDDDNDDSTNNNNQRFINLNKAPSPNTIAKSTKIYTMFPQMPHPLPSPTTTTPQQLREEITTRSQRMQDSGRDPHVDKYGRVYTHISTSNVSNTIHGVYMTLDASEVLPPGLEGGDGDDVPPPPPAYDLFGTESIEREWVSLDDLKVTEVMDGRSIIGECDTKSQFISGFIVRQLIKDGVIGVDLE